MEWGRLGSQQALHLPKCELLLGVLPYSGAPDLRAEAMGECGFGGSCGKTGEFWQANTVMECFPEEVKITIYICLSFYNLSYLSSFFISLLSAISTHHLSIYISIYLSSSSCIIYPPTFVHVCVCLGVGWSGVR